MRSWVFVFLYWLSYKQTSFCNQLSLPLQVSRRNASLRHFCIGFIFLRLPAIYTLLTNKQTNSGYAINLTSNRFTSAFYIPNRGLFSLKGNNKHLWCPAYEHLPPHTLLCQDVWNWPYFIQSESTALANSVYCKLNKMHLSEHLSRYLTRSCLASGCKAKGNIKDWRCEKEEASLGVFLSRSAGFESSDCGRGFSLFTCSSTKPRHDTQALPCDSSSLSVKSVHVGGIVTLTIHHGYAAAQTWTQQVNVREGDLRFKGLLRGFEQSLYSSKPLPGAALIITFYSLKLIFFLLCSFYPKLTQLFYSFWKIVCFAR